MKKLFLVAICLISSTHSTRAMEGALLGAAVPGLVGLCYAIAGSDPVDQKVGQWALATGGGAVVGGVSQLALYAMLSNPATAAGATAFIAATSGCGITALWTLLKIMPTRPLGK